MHNKYCTIESLGRWHAKTSNSNDKTLHERCEKGRRGSGRKLFPTEHALKQDVELMRHTSIALREQARRKQIVSAVLLVIVIFQFAELPGALMMHTAIDIGTVVLGLALCAVAALFNQFGKI